MNLCSENHNEVCYETRSCPACSLRDELQRVIDRRDATIEELESTIEDLKEQRDAEPE